jgi:hypothetical protein
MAGKLLDHVIEKADPGGDIESAGAIEVYLDDNIGFVGLASDTSGAHGGAIESD